MSCHGISWVHWSYLRATSQQTTAQQNEITASAATTSVLTDANNDARKQQDAWDQAAALRKQKRLIEEHGDLWFENWRAMATAKNKRKAEKKEKTDKVKIY